MKKQLTEKEKRYLDGFCDEWIIENYCHGLEIISIMEYDNHENGIVHCYLRNENNGCCYDVRGEFESDEEIIRYAGVSYNADTTEEFVFDDLEDFKKYLKWVDFEIVKRNYMF